AEDFDGPLGFLVRVDDDLDLERFALLDLRRGVDGGDLDLGVLAGGQRDGRDGDAGAEGGLQGVALGGVAVGDEDDLGVVAGGDAGGGDLDSGGEVGPL